MSSLPSSEISTVRRRLIVLFSSSKCMLMLYLDSCAGRFFSLVERDPGVGSWEVMHSKSGGRKT